MQGDTVFPRVYLFFGLVAADVIRITVLQECAPTRSSAHLGIRWELIMEPLSNLRSPSFRVSPALVF